LAFTLLSLPLLALALLPLTLLALALLTFALLSFALALLLALAAGQLTGRFQAFANILVGDDLLAGNFDGALASGGNRVGEALGCFFQSLGSFLGRL
jgi:hypothetical protein